MPIALFLRETARSCGIDRHINKTKRTNPMMRVAVLLSLVLALAACETTKGLGRDVQNAGEALDDAI